MHPLMAKFKKYFYGLAKRDQIALAITASVVVLLIWFTAVYAPLSEAVATVDRDIVKKDSELIVVQAKIKGLQQDLGQDQGREDREQLEKYVEENARLDQELTKTSTQIMNPQEMVSLLEQMLKSQTKLKFISLKNKPATPEFVEARDESSNNTDKVSTIYRHTVVLQMEGSYHSALSYMKILEQLPWRFFWQGIEIETKKYPEAAITLEVYTLGFREGLIGV